MEENKENMSVEDILGSIKNILEDVVVQKKDEETEEVKKEPTIDPIVENSLDEAPVVVAEEEEDDEVMDLLESQIVVPDLSDVDVNAETKVEEKSSEDNAEDIMAGISSLMENLPEPEIVVDEPAPVVEEPVVVAVPEPEVVAPAPVVEEPVVAPAPVDEPEVVVAPAPAPVVEEKPKKEASADILNSFAKMFSAQPKEEVVVAPAPVVEEKSVQTGDLSKTLEDMVVEIINKNVADVNFAAIADKKVQNWLNDNLQGIVEKLVKEQLEEIRRQAGQ
ncbi:MAG: hypothetical protein R3Y43_02150 [Alphaproteobacteria bacterium]